MFSMFIASAGGFVLNHDYLGGGLYWIDHASTLFDHFIIYSKNDSLHFLNKHQLLS